MIEERNRTACEGSLAAPCSPSLLDVFCGVGGWTKTFKSRGWNCVGVDLADFSAEYPGEFVQADALTLGREWIDQFDAVLMSPPCEEYARAWLPWLRGDKQPAKWALDLLEWSVALCDRPGRMVECSNFSARHVAGSIRVGSYSLWGDVPLLIRDVPRGKMAKSGMRPELRAEIPDELARSVAEWFECNPKIIGNRSCLIPKNVGSFHRDERHHTNQPDPSRNPCCP